MKILYDKETYKYYIHYKCKKCNNSIVSKVDSYKKALKHKQKCVHCNNDNQDKNKPVTFKNLLTNQVAKGKSISSFCERFNLGKNAKYHFCDVLKGKRLHHKGWGLNKNYKFDASKIKIITQFSIKDGLIK